MSRLLALLLLFPFAVAHDEHATLYGFAPTSNIIEPGYGAELATTVGNRTVIAIALQWPAATNVSLEQLQLRSDLRLLYNSELNTQWYPTISVSGTVSNPSVKPWLGAGFQRELFSELSLMGEALWQPLDNTAQLRLGLRIWFSRFSSLDARVRSAKPQGATFESKGASKPTQEDVAVSVLAVPRPSASNGPALKETQVTEKDPQSTTGERAVEELEPGWYVHLGLFQVESSLRFLQNDARLSNYQSQMVVWFDETKQGYRLLLGPMQKPRSLVIVETLKQHGIESFLYTGPSKP